MGESSFWYRPTRVVPDQRPLNGRCCWLGAGVVVSLEQGADLHMAQLMPLPLTISCFTKIQIGFAFLVPAHPGSPGQRAVKRVCVCVCVCVCASALLFLRRIQMNELICLLPMEYQEWNPESSWRRPLKDIENSGPINQKLQEKD